MPINARASALVLLLALFGLCQCLQHPSAKHFFDRISLPLAPSLAWAARADPKSSLVFSLIDNRDITMNHPVIGISIEEELKVIWRTIDLGADNRAKALYMTVRGMGGGKTRILEEMRHHLFLDPSVIPLAVAANCDTTYDGDEIKPGLSTDALRSAALSISARMLHCVSQAPLSDILGRMNDCRLSPRVTAHNILESAVDCAAEMVQKVCPDARKLVLFCDEMKRIQDELMQVYPDTKDLFAPLRSALRRPGCALVVSSLTPFLSGFTTSGYSVHATPLPEVLEPDAVLQRWWKVDQAEPAVRHSLRCLAGALASTPRGLQVAGTVISERYQNGTLSNQIAPDVFQAVLSALREKYAAAIGMFPEPSLFYEALYGSARPLAADVLSYIETSVLTNSLRDSDLCVTAAPVKIVPSVNLMLLCLAAEQATLTDTSTLAIKQMVTSIIKRAVVSDKVHEKSGDLLEHLFFPAWLQVRLSAASAARREVSFADLLGLHKLNLPDALDCVLRVRFDVGVQLAKEHKLTLSSHGCTAQQFREHIDSFPVGPKDPIIVLKCAESESADYLLVAWDPDAPDGRTRVFVDLKSKVETEASADHRAAQQFYTLKHKAELPGGGSQYEHMKETLQNTPFAYLYFTTHLVHQWTPPYNSTSPDSVIMSGRDVAERFFRPAMPFYDALRSEL
jgi:hypothetical protein